MENRKYTQEKGWENEKEKVLNPNELSSFKDLGFRVKEEALG